MVAYSFKRRFVTPIQIGLGHRPPEPNIEPKTHTIRDRRKIRGRDTVFGHAFPDEKLQLYCMQRTVDGFFIGEAICTSVHGILLNFWPGPPMVKSEALTHWREGGLLTKAQDLDKFARSDGFGDWLDMCAFWKEEHDGILEYSGYIISWRPMHVSAGADPS